MHVENINTIKCLLQWVCTMIKSAQQWDMIYYAVQYINRSFTYHKSYVTMKYDF
jgi:hypothetical protein